MWGCELILYPHIKCVHLKKDPIQFHLYPTHPTHKPLFRPESLPPWYESAYQSLAVEGVRVLAMGYRQLPQEETAAAAGGDRGRVEQPGTLTFAGLAAFRTQIRRDSRRVIKQLADAGGFGWACVWACDVDGGGRGV
jgi:hypothetical protein